MALRLMEAARALVGGAMTSRACTEHFLGRIRSRDASVQAWAALDEGRALALAAECDRPVSRGAEVPRLRGGVSREFGNGACAPFPPANARVDAATLAATGESGRAADTPGRAAALRDGGGA